MQPVTITSKHFTNTLWLSQAVLLLLLIVLLWAMVNIHIWLSVFIPLVLLFLYVNRQTMIEQSNLKFTMRTNGRLAVTRQNIEGSMNRDVDSDDEMIVEVKSFWYLPQILTLKLNIKSIRKPVYLTLFRSVVKPSFFSHLLVGLTQLNKK